MVSVDLSRTWQGILAVEGVTAPDGRQVARGGLSLRASSPLYMSDQTVIGTIDRIWREGNLVHGAGRASASAPTGELPIAVDVEAVEAVWAEAWPEYMVRGIIVGALLDRPAAWPEAVIRIEAGGA